MDTGPNGEVVRSRRRVLCSILLFAVVGVPIWWKTTEVHRAPLDTVGIRKWAKQELFPNDLKLVMNMYFHEPGNNGSETSSTYQDLASEVENELNIRYGNGLYGKSVDPQPRQLENSTIWTDVHLRFKLYAHTMTSPTENISTASSENGQYNVNVFCAERNDNSIHIKSDRSITVKTTHSCHAKVGGLFQEEQRGYSALSETKQSDLTNWENMRTFKYAPEYHVTFSLLNAEPSETMVSWDIERAINTYIRPLFSKLSVISDFEVQSQVQNYADLPMTPEPINNNGHVEHLMRPTMLSHFINSAEWNLASAVSSAPPLNFIVYIPKKAFSPLFVAKSNGDHIATNSFLMPRWGGVLVQNQPESSSHHFTQEMLQPIMEVFVAQIRDLMGIKRVRLPLPDLDPATRISVEYDSAPDVGLTDWELDTLVRTRTIQNLVDAIVTLQSLANLVEKLENMVVMDKIQKLVSNSLKSLDQASQALHDRNYTSASIHARAAIVSSEAAFFDPTMVSMLYFPDEHKYAVYMPFFIPVIVPVTLALIKELKGWKTQRSLSSKSKTE